MAGSVTKFWACALMACAALAGGAAATEQLGGSAAPDFALKSVSGKNVRLSEHRGEVVMLSFGAAWCGDCRSQLQSLDEVQTRYADEGVRLIAVNLDLNMSQARDAAASLGSTYPVLHDAGGQVGRLYDVREVPVMVLVDRDGVVREVFEGYRRGVEEQYLERVRALLAE